MTIKFALICMFVVLLLVCLAFAQAFEEEMERMEYEKQVRELIQCAYDLGRARHLKR